MSHGRGSEAQAIEGIDRLQRSGLFDPSAGGKPAISEYRPDADLRDAAQVPLLEDGCNEAAIRRDGLADGLLKGAKA